MDKKKDDEVISSTARATTRVWKDFQKQLIEEDLTMQEGMDEALLDWITKRGTSASGTHAAQPKSKASGR